jgi:hypothetical protein
VQSVLIADLDEEISMMEGASQFEDPSAKVFSKDPKRHLRSGRDINLYCLRWIWFQWLHGTPTQKFKPRIEKFIERGLALRTPENTGDEWRGLYDILLFSCAVFIDDGKLMAEIAREMVDLPRPKRSDALRRAWCGVIKFWMAGEIEKAKKQAALMYSSDRPLNMRLPSKPVMDAFLAEDWKKFNKSLEKVFESLWKDLRKYPRLMEEKNGRAKVRMEGQSVMQDWPWPDMCLALLAHRKGVGVPSDPLWLPEIALKNGSGK